MRSYECERSTWLLGGFGGVTNCRIGVKREIIFLTLAVSLSLFCRSALGDTLTESGTFNYSFPYTLEGYEETVPLTVPCFNSALGTLTEVSIYHSTTFSCDAISDAQGGAYIPPYWEDNWNWAVDFQFTYSGPGFSVPCDSYQSSYGGGNYTSYAHSAEVDLSNVQAVSNEENLTSASPDFLNYIGSGDTVSTSFSAVETTAISPLPATPAGFYWSISQITAAGIDMSASSTVDVVYTYTPTPEASATTLLICGLLVTANVRNRRITRLGMD